MVKKEKNDKFYSESYSKIKRVLSQTSPKSHLSYLILFIYFDTSLDTPFISIRKFSITSFNALFIYIVALFSGGLLSLSLSRTHTRAHAEPLFLSLSLTLFFSPYLIPALFLFLT